MINGTDKTSQRQVDGQINQHLQLVDFLLILEPKHSMGKKPEKPEENKTDNAKKKLPIKWIIIAISVIVFFAITITIVLLLNNSGKKTRAKSVHDVWLAMNSIDVWFGLVWFLYSPPCTITIYITASYLRMALDNGTSLKRGPYPYTQTCVFPIRLGFDRFLLCLGELQNIFFVYCSTSYSIIC